jgi:hypothetical protein
VLILLAALAGASDPFADSVQAGRLDADLVALADPELGIRSRHIQHPDHDLATEYVLDAFDQIGLVVTTDPFTYDGLDLVNVIAELPGVDPSLPPVLLSAHYDSTAKADSDTWDPTTDPAPGADDDAAGVAAVLEVARVLYAHPAGFSRTVRFVLFTAEEQGMVGSTAYVEGLVARGEDIHMLLQLDPFGYNPTGGNRLWFAFDARWETEATALVDRGEEIGSPLLVTAIDAAFIDGDERSDHFPFWQAGMPALHIGNFPPAPTYHTEGDTIDVVDPTFMEHGTQVVAAHMAAMAGPLTEQEEEPAACGCSSGGSAAWWLACGLVLLYRRQSQTTASEPA